MGKFKVKKTRKAEPNEILTLFFSKPNDRILNFFIAEKGRERKGGCAALSFQRTFPFAVCFIFFFIVVSFIHNNFLNFNFFSVFGDAKRLVFVLRSFWEGWSFFFKSFFFCGGFRNAEKKIKIKINNSLRRENRKKNERRSLFSV